MTLWVFGHSGCLPFNIPNGIGWVDSLAQLLGIDYKNFAQAAADNLFIYHSILCNLKSMSDSDIVIVGWSHPNRKSFVLDRTQTIHVQAVKQGCIVFDGNPEFFRSKGTTTDTMQKWSNMIPTKQGNDFFDTWFDRYHNEYECRLNFKAYCDSAKQRIPCKYLPFYFNQESVEHAQPDEFYWLDFIVQNQVWISESDMHPNQQGHDKMAKVFFELLDMQSK